MPPVVLSISEEYRLHASGCDIKLTEQRLAAQDENEALDGEEFDFHVWISGLQHACLVVVGLIIGTRHSNRVSTQPGSVPDVEVVQVEQKDVPSYGEWIGTLDSLTNADDGEILFNQSGSNGFDSGISEEIV
jgi:hypothetical protein